MLQGINEGDGKAKISIIEIYEYHPTHISYRSQLLLHQISMLMTAIFISTIK